MVVTEVGTKRIYRESLLINSNKRDLKAMDFVRPVYSTINFIIYIQNV